MSEKEVQANAEKVNRAEITASKECITAAAEIIEDAIKLARDIRERLCSRDIDSNDRRATEANAASAHIEDAIECLSLVMAYDTATLAVDRIGLKED